MVVIKKDQSKGIGCVITLFIIGVLLPTLLGILAITGLNRQPISGWPSAWLMLKPYIVVFPIAWAGFLTGYYYKPLIGGVLLIVAGLVTIAGPVIAIQMMSAGQGDQDVFLFFPPAVFIGIALLISGYSFITSRKVR